MSYANRVVEKLGGTRKAASRLNRPASTVQSWKGRGAIPSRIQQEILDLAQREGIEISPADFFETPDFTPSEPAKDAAA